MNPYEVPSMEQINNITWNGFNVVSTFSGCGGSSLGYKIAGFRVLMASEFIPEAQVTYRANHPTTILDGRDIRVLRADEVLTATCLRSGELDLFDGSPPCSSFSTAGSRESGWGKVRKYSDSEQRTDDLFYEYIRLIDGIKPKVFVAENVSGLVKGTAKGYFLDILKRMKQCGYRVGCKLLDAQWLGVPQQRQRTIFVGVREDIGLDPVFPKPMKFRYSIRDAIPWIDNPHSVAGPETDIGKYAVGKEWDAVREGEASKKYFSLVKPLRSKPCPTIQASHGTSSIASVLHPTTRRRFTIAELKRICSFPDDFILTGTYAQQWERLGRAVPPIMMSKIAETIRDEILNKQK